MKKNNRKGFTLIELLAVIIVLALILVFAIPAVLDTSEKAQKKTFATYGRKVLTLAQQYIETEKMDGRATLQTAFVNSAESGFSLGTNDTEYDVCVVYNPTETGDNKYLLYMRNDSFYVDGVTDSQLKVTTNVNDMNPGHVKTEVILQNNSNNECEWTR